MSQSYQALARQYRPQKFCDVCGQEAIVTTLKNALKNNTISHAYLFSGPRGTGKTSLARLLAKTLNCQNISKDFEPCDTCTACKEIAHGSSLDVLEVDGASHRGIDDIRKINETISFSPSSQYKIYIIDEVHMLTKEAFNALLKTLEEPPEKVKFFFATTEAHKVPATIISRCQRFNLKRIPSHTIVEKLQRISSDLQKEVEDAALFQIAQVSEGCLRDAESLLDQVLSFSEEAISLQTVQAILGIPDQERFFLLDQKGKEGNYDYAFELIDSIQSEGKNLHQFFFSLIDHFRTLLIMQTSKGSFLPRPMQEHDKQKYQKASSLYSRHQLLDILEILQHTIKELKTSSCPQVTAEMAILALMRTHERLPIDAIVSKLCELEAKLPHTSSPSASVPPSPAITEKKQAPVKATEASLPLAPPKSSPPPKKEVKKEAPRETKKEPSKERKPSPAQEKSPSSTNKPRDRKEKSRHDTIMRFAAVELGGILKKT